MAKIVVSQFITVDGVIEDPGGSENHERGGWAFQFDRGDVGNQFKLDEVMASDALLLGRTTYEGFAEAWPSRDGDFADKFNGMRKYVVSSTLEDPEWNNSVVIEPEDLARTVAELREADGGDVLVNGSARLVRELLERDLVDELRLMVFPLVLGRRQAPVREPGAGQGARARRGQAGRRDLHPHLQAQGGLIARRGAGPQARPSREIGLALGLGTLHAGLDALALLAGGEALVLEEPRLGLRDRPRRVRDAVGQLAQPLGAEVVRSCRRPGGSTRRTGHPRCRRRSPPARAS